MYIFIDYVYRRMHVLYRPEAIDENKGKFIYLAPFKRKAVMYISWNYMKKLKIDWIIFQ